MATISVLVCDGCGRRLDDDLAVLDLIYIHGKRQTTTFHADLCDECAELTVIRIPKRRKGPPSRS